MHCARNQVSLTLHGDAVVLKQVGKNSGKLGEETTVEGSTYRLKSGQEFALLATDPATTFGIQFQTTSTASTEAPKVEPTAPAMPVKRKPPVNKTKEAADFVSKKTATEAPAPSSHETAKESHTQPTTTDVPETTTARPTASPADSNYCVVKRGDGLPRPIILALCDSVLQPTFVNRFAPQIKALSSSHSFAFFAKDDFTGIPHGEIKDKIGAALDKLKFDSYVAIAGCDNFHRLPLRSMWHELERVAGNIDLSKCTVIGEEAGRTKYGRDQKDKKATDRKFAINIGASFRTPGEYFNSEQQRPFEIKAYDPRTLPPQPANDMTKLVAKSHQEMIVSVGPAGCGKTSITNIFTSKGYVQINQDTLKTWQKCVKLATEAVAQGKSVIIDNTNPDVENRARYLDIAKATKIPARCLHFNISIDHANHNNQYRFLSTEGRTPLVPFIAYPYFKSKYLAPELSEGFTDILQVYFHPHFSSDSARDMYMQILT